MQCARDQMGSCQWQSLFLSQNTRCAKEGLFETNRSAEQTLAWLKLSWLPQEILCYDVLLPIRKMSQYSLLLLFLDIFLGASLVSRSDYREYEKGCK